MSAAALVRAANRDHSLGRRFYFVHPEGTYDDERLSWNKPAGGSGERTNRIAEFVEHRSPASKDAKR